MTYEEGPTRWLVAFTNKWNKQLYSDDFSRSFDEYHDAFDFFLHVKNFMQNTWETTYPDWKYEGSRIDINTNITDDERLEKKLDLQYELVCRTKKVGVYLLNVQMYICNEGEDNELSG